VSVLVTGGTGVIGSHVVRSLAAAGTDVVATSTRGDLSLMPDLRGSVPVERCDVRDVDGARRLIERHRVDCVIHLAALLHAACDADPVEAVEVNVTGTAALYQACAGLGVERFVYGSSKGAYGDLPAEHRAPRYRAIGEDVPAKPMSVYDATKYAGELVLATQASLGGPEVVSLRFATIYGPGKRARHGNTAVLSVLIEEAAAGRDVAFERGADQVDDMIYVEDAAEGVVRAAQAPALRHSLYNVGTGVGVRFGDFAAEVGRQHPGVEVRVGPGLEYMGPGAVYGPLEVTRARDDLGFGPCCGPADGVRRYVAALAELA
jgi:UDP-glucose 4-epimerase